MLAALQFQFLLAGCHIAAPDINQEHHQIIPT